MRSPRFSAAFTLISYIGELTLSLLFFVPLALADNQTSVIAPLAQQSLILDGTIAGDAIIVVGERGHVLKSVDQGNSWQQIRVPTRATLTAVAFIDADHGFVVGHDAVILRSQDGGESWQQVYEAVEEENPLLDVYMHSRNNITVVGAYGLYLHSKNGGSTWDSRQLTSFNLNQLGLQQNANAQGFVDDFHLNQITVSDTGRWYIAAEAGTLYRSDDKGFHWQRLAPPYEGSFFGTLPLAGDEVLTYGLQGRLFSSDDAGETWQRIETGTQATLTNALMLRDGGVVITGYLGSVLFAHHAHAEFKLIQLEQRMGISSGIQLHNGDLLLLGTGGMLRLPLEQLTN